MLGPGSLLPVLVEREEELYLLEELLDACFEGSGQVALISATAGHGKTALLHTFAEFAKSRNALVLTAVSAEAEFPWGVLAQLYDNPEISAKDAEQANSMLREHAFVAERSGTGQDDQRLDGAITYCLRRMLLGLSKRAPVVVCVDDVQHADRPSLRVLSHLVRGLSSARVMVVLAERAQPYGHHRPLHTELLRLPNYLRVRLRPLSINGLAEMISSRVADVTTANKLAFSWYPVCGGSPLFARALLDDYQSHSPEEAARERPRHLVGDAYGQAVLGYLHSSEPTVLSVARVLAVLDGDGSPELLGQLVDSEQETVSSVLDSLNLAGLLDGHGFRHPVAVATITSDMSTSDHQRIHWRAARLLFETGAPVTSVARHLLAANVSEAPWAVGVLIEAAEQALLTDQVDLATSCLEMAHRCGAGAAEQATILAALTDVEWRTCSLRAAHRFPQLLTALRDGHLDGPKSLWVLQMLVWYGWFDSAEDVIDRLADVVGTRDPRGRMELRTTQMWLSRTAPPIGDRLRRALAHLPSGDQATSEADRDRQLREIAALETRMKWVRGKAATAAIERMLADFRLDGSTFDHVTGALRALTHAEEFEKATHWTDRFLTEAATRSAPSWHAVLAAIRAEIAMRQGELPIAVRCARLALTTMPAESWGVMIGEPLGVLLRAATEMCDRESAAGLVAQEVPAGMFRTRSGLSYLYARGYYYLDAGWYVSALDDFANCGELMSAWGLDRPYLFPWRSGMAEVLLRLGETDWAKRLIREQVSRAGRYTRAKGLSLRVLAATEELEQRPRVLNRAIAALTASGDRLELAKALADLSRAHGELGDSKRAREIARHALSVVTECGAENLRRSLVGTDSGIRVDLQTESASNGDGYDRLLTSAECRVAALAAQGHTNREIAAGLYITISTVEQHLTRIYRKLNVKRRSELVDSFRNADAGATIR